MPRRMVSEASDPKKKVLLPGPKTEPIRKHLRLAIFDDMPDILSLYGDLLCPLKVDIVPRCPVSTVAEAMKIFRLEKPDLVITDLCLTQGGTEGFIILFKIKHESPGIPVALSTSVYSPSSENPICQKIRKMDFDAVFNKGDLKGISTFVSSRISS